MNNKLNIIINTIDGGKDLFNELIKSNQNLKKLRLETYRKNGHYSLLIKDYFNKEGLKKRFTYKEWFNDNFSKVLFDYTLSTKYIKVYEYKNKEKLKNFNSLNECLNFIRGKKEEPKKRKTKNNNDIVFVFSVGDSSNKYKIKKNKRGEFIYYLDNKLIEPSKIKVVHEELIELLASLNIYQNEEVPKINS